MEAEKAREKAESVELRLAREVDRSLWEHEKCQMLLQQIQIYFEKEKKNIQNHQKSEKDKREKYEQRLYNTSNIILFAISVLGGLLAVIIAVSALVGFRYFKNVKDEINKIKKEVINDANDIKRQRENLNAYPKNDDIVDKKTVRQAQETSKNPNTENIIRSQAILYTNKEQWSEAYIFWKAVLEKEPNTPDAYFYIALSAHMLADKIKSNNEKQKWFDIAEENYRQSVQVSPDNISSWCNWGILCTKRGEAASSPEEKGHWFKQAAEKFAQATRREPGHVTSWFNWGNLCMKRGEATLSPDEREHWFKQAAEKYEQATRRDPTHVDSLCNWGILCVKRGEAMLSPAEREYWFKQATEKFAQATEKNPKDVDSWCRWGNLYTVRGETALSPAEREYWFKQAAEKYEQAIGRDPGDVGSWCNWGILCTDRGKAASSPEERERWFKQAAEKYEQATRRDPEHSASWYNWAYLESLRGNVALCVDYLEKWYALSADASVTVLDHTNFDPVRNSPEFIAFREKVQKGCGR